MIVFCGTVRDCERSLPKSLLSLDRMLKEVTGSHCVLVTNDNKDNTRGILTRWAQERHEVRIIDLEGLASRVPKREPRLAIARNAYLESIQYLPQSLELVVVLDMDGLNDDVTSAALRAAIASAPTGWTALFANQTGPYYDLHALRCTGWVERSVWDDVDKYLVWFRRSPLSTVDRWVNGRIGKNAKKAVIERQVGAKQYLIPSDRAPISVRSAFGGLGIYRRSALNDARYHGQSPDEKLVCEHVPFHLALTKRGYRLYILPSLLNQSPAEHLWPGAGRTMSPKMVRRLSLAR